MSEELRGAKSRPSMVLMYHRIGWPNARSIVRHQYVLPALLRSQVRTLLSRGYRPLALVDMLSQPHREVEHFSVTFDDGYASVRRYAYQILADLQTPATIFVVAGAIGKTNAWDERIGDCTEQMVTAPELREMSAAGFEIGSHTVSHAHLTRLTDGELRAELTDSRKALEDLTGRPVRGLAYPYGEWDARVRDAAVESGYSYAVTAVRGAIRRPMDPFQVPRINVRWDTIGPFLMRKIRQAYRQDGSHTRQP